MKLKIVRAINGQGVACIALADENGNCLPGQVSAHLVTSARDATRCTVEFIVGQDVTLALDEVGKFKSQRAVSA